MSFDFDDEGRPRSRKGRVMAETLAEQLRTGRERHVALVEAGLPGGGRADVLTFRPAYGKHDMTVYEVKVSRADFLSDVNAGKYRKYFASCHRLFFVTPAGLIKKVEVPEHCGLVTQQDHGGFRVVKPALRREIEPPDHEWMWSLVEQAWYRDVPAQRRIKDRVIAEENGELRVMSWRLGQETSRLLHDAEYQRKNGTDSTEARNAMYLAERLMTLAHAAGIERDNRMWQELTQDELGRLAEHAVKLLVASDRVRIIADYLKHLDEHKGVEIDAKVGVESSAGTG